MTITLIFHWFIPFMSGLNVSFVPGLDIYLCRPTHDTQIHKRIHTRKYV